MPEPIETLDSPYLSRMRSAAVRGLSPALATAFVEQVQLSFVAFERPRVDTPSRRTGVWFHALRNNARTSSSRSKSSCVP
jgi:hypothetical protein